MVPSTNAWLLLGMNEVISPVTAGEEAQVRGEDWFVAQNYLGAVRHGIDTHRDSEHGGCHPEPVNDKYQHQVDHAGS